MPTTLLVYGFSYDTFPGGHYIHPFQGRTYGYLEDEGKEHPRTVRFPSVTSRLCDLTGRLLYLQVVEMRMCALSNTIREKPDWWEKIKDPSLVEKWTQEALDQQRGEYRIRQLTRRMVNTPCPPLTRDSPGSKIDYVFQELHGYASIRDPKTGIEVR